MEIKRYVNLRKILKEKSFFLFGPRATGKSFLIKNQFDGTWPVVNLLQSQYYLPLSQNPSTLKELVGASECAVIDEIQKLPELLDEIHHLIENSGKRFLLTGSSARKLKQRNANMLGGRASKIDFFSLTWKELEDAKKFDLDRILRYGGLPRVYLNEDPDQELFDYVDVYLKEEIRMEASVRKLPEFSRFLKIASTSSGQLLNFANIASDVGGISAQTVKNYFEILDDTLLGFMLPPWRAGRSRKAVATSKHYFFDCGVANTLAGTRHLDRNSSLFGDCFEQFIINEVRAFLSYNRKRIDLAFWRTQHGDEVDLIIGEELAIEIKATARLSPSDGKGLRKIKEEGHWQRRILVSQDEVSRVQDGNLHMMHWRSFLRDLWDGRLL